MPPKKPAADEAVHYLANKTQQAIFRQAATNGHMHVLAVLSASEYVDMEMDIEKARAYYRKLLDEGWKVPKTPKMTEATLRASLKGRR